MAFKRRAAATAKTTPPPVGTRPLTASTVLVTSTGIASLDDILGGGIPLSSTLAIFCPNPHASHGDLILKHYVSQGLIGQQQVLICDPSRDKFYETSIWVRENAVVPPPQDQGGDDVNIAWRYKHMKQFQTTVADDDEQADGYRHPLDLTAPIPTPILQQSIDCGQLLVLPAAVGSPEQILSYLVNLLQTRKSGPEVAPPLRVCMRNVGSLDWGFEGQQDLFRFLFSLRGIIKGCGAEEVCMLATLPPHLSDDIREPHWTAKVSNVFDTSMTFEAFDGKPWMEEAFQTQHGLVHIHRLPCPLTLSPPSDRTSMLRGLKSGGVGENNLVFRCTRRRLVIETLHLDVEGGVGERRTMPAPAPTPTKSGLATIEVEIEGTGRRKQVKFEEI